MPILISIINHKGGVGKTTLTYNLAAIFTDMGKRVLLVDADPQCNLSTYVIDPDYFNELLDGSDADDGLTIWSALKPVSEGSGSIRLIRPMENPAVGYLIPGDIMLSSFEADLYTFWSECYQRRTRGFRGTTALSDLVRKIASDLDIDYVLLDSGPNIGALNRVVVLDSDYYIVAAACDVFSTRAVATMGATLADWITTWGMIAELAPDGVSLLSGRPVFLGYIPQSFKVYRGMVSAQAALMPGLDKAIRSDLVHRLRAIDRSLVVSDSNFALPAVQHFGALATTSQAQGEPMYRVEGGSAELVEKAKDIFTSLAGEIIRRVGLAK